MPSLSRVIEACAYNPEMNILAFRHKDVRVVVEKKKVMINDIENETEARKVMDWLAGLVAGNPVV